MVDSYYFFYSKKIQVKKNTKQDLSHYADLFDFSMLIHPQKDELFESNVKLNKTSIDNFDYIADITASVITKFVNTADSKSQNLGKGIACCKDILNHIGFRQIQTSSLPEFIASDRKEEVQHVILTLGCQTPEIIESRATAAARLYTKLCDITQKPALITVYFSGSSPNPRKKQITQYEYNELHNFFFQEIGSISEFKENFVDIKIDHKSHNTATNISECIHNHLLPRFPNRKINLFIVSSTFHMIRSSQSLMMELNRTSTRNALKQKQIEINGIFLVGSESYSAHKGVVEHRNYVKNMFYDITHYFLKNSILSRASRSR